MYEIVPEPLGGAHYDAEKTAATLKEHLVKHLDELIKMTAEERLQGRYGKFRAFGHFEEKIASVESEVPQAGPASA